ncbi:hypothetical protein C8F04DRAFT_1139453 [Mycena alexandri]|uniref:BTB domain-containing protein n=1 Tax=Mycena alexandri TaxID=1745969 RepID=A0AAD6WSJ5_9AGAR|nr:hypothetical protein C8F04DRAFT_1139453 [Mycena alexandri]
MSAMQTTKRRRPESSDGAPADPVRSDIWFDDGNIILQADNTQFRVYKGSLYHFSEVLKTAMENMGDSKGAEGCPLLFLSDSTVELGYVLRALFYRSYPDNTPIAFDVNVAFLRLGRKYEMKPLYDSAQTRITKAFPSSVEEYYPTDLLNFITERRGNIAAESIVIARELELRHLLPAAFWFMARRFELLGDDKANSLSPTRRQSFWR